MDSDRFDGLTRSVSTLLSRRTLAGGLGLGMVALPNLSEAKHKHKHKHKKKKKVKHNDFGCVNVGSFCKNADQCCSGICQGKKDKKKCQAHDTGGCQPGSATLGCGGDKVDCTTSAGSAGLCGTTTGNAGYCFNAVAIGPPCSKDADCQAETGSSTAACIVCATSEPFCANGILF
jgi:hypothetical protein